MRAWGKNSIENFIEVSSRKFRKDYLPAIISQGSLI